MTENHDMENTAARCPGCGRHCELTAPHCPRGEEYARTGVLPERGEGHEHHEHGEGRGRHEHDGGHGCRGPRGLGPGGPLPGSEEYAALDTDGKLAAVLREVRHLSRARMESKGGQARILGILSRRGSMTQKELTERLGIRPGSVSEVIGKLERGGLIERRENESDRRTADIRLTEEGRVRASEQEREKKADLFTVFSDEEKQTLLSLLEKLVADWQERFPPGEGRGRPPRET